MDSGSEASAYSPPCGGITESYRPLSVEGDATTKNMEAIDAIHLYLENSGTYKELDELLSYLIDDKGIDVSFDPELPPYVLGQTARKGNLPYFEISLNPRIYNKSYTELDDGSDEQLITKYLQAGTLIHEKVHELTIKSPKVLRAVGVLEKMGYGEDNIRGFLEMLAEKYTIGSLLASGQDDLAWVGRRYTPYRRALEAGDNLDSFFVYGEKEEYRGLQGFIEALAGGKLNNDPETVDKYLGGIEVKLSGEHQKPYDGINQEANILKGYIHEVFSGSKEKPQERYGILEPVRPMEPAKIGLGVIPPN